MKTMRWFPVGMIGALLVAPGTLIAYGPPPPEEIKAEQAAAFAQADADANGTLSLDEFKTFESLMREQMAQHHFRRVDANGDGAVSLDELEAAKPGPGRGRGCPWRP